MYMETNSQSFNLSIFTQETKKMCLYTATSIFIIILFVITPLRFFFKTSFFMKMLSIILMGYIIFLNYKQTDLLKSASSLADSIEIQSQLNTNILFSYIFTFFIGLLIIFVFKSMSMIFF
jgi:hypothetical protein